MSALDGMALQLVMLFALPSSHILPRKISRPSWQGSREENEELTCRRPLLGRDLNIQICCPHMIPVEPTITMNLIYSSRLKTGICSDHRLCNSPRPFLSEARKRLTTSCDLFYQVDMTMSWDDVRWC